MDKIEHNVETGEIIVRQMTKSELDQMAKDHAAIAAEKTAKATKEAAKAALLAKLGITNDEAVLLLS
jgi:hypothetical protein